MKRLNSVKENQWWQEVCGEQKSGCSDINHFHVHSEKLISKQIFLPKILLTFPEPQLVVETGGCFQRRNSVAFQLECSFKKKKKRFGPENWNFSCAWSPVPLNSEYLYSQIITQLSSIFSIWNTSINLNWSTLAPTTAIGYCLFGWLVSLWEQNGSKYPWMVLLLDQRFKKEKCNFSAGLHGGGSLFLFLFLFCLHFRRETIWQLVSSGENGKFGSF